MRYGYMMSLVLLIWGLGVYSQQDPGLTFYRYNMNLYNPAYAGSNEGIGLGLGVLSEWAGVEGAPETQTLFFGLPIGRGVGLGLSLINDRTFVETQTWASFDFSYRVRLKESTDLFLGLKVGASSFGVNREGLMTYGIVVDPSLSGLSGRFSPNIGAGAFLRGRRYFVSLSAPKLLGSDRLESVGKSTGLGRERLHLYGALGYDVPLGGGTVLRPSLMARYVDDAPWDLDATLALAIGERLELGAAHRFEERTGGFFLFRATPSLSIGYAYGSPVSGSVRKVANGSHEVFMGLSF